MAYCLVKCIERNESLMNIQVIGASKESFKRTFRKSESHNHPEVFEPEDNFFVHLFFISWVFNWVAKKHQQYDMKIVICSKFSINFLLLPWLPSLGLLQKSFFLFSLSIIPSGRCFFKAWNNLKEVWQAKIQRLSLKTPWRLRFAPHLLLKEYEAMYQIPTNTDINYEYIKMNTFSIKDLLWSRKKLESSNTHLLF